MVLRNRINNLYRVFIQFIQKQNEHGINLDLSKFLNKLEKTRRIFCNAEQQLDTIQTRKSLSNKNGEEILQIWENEGIKAIVAKRISKPNIIHVEKVKEMCNCEVEIERFSFESNYKQILVIDKLEDLKKLEENLKTCTIEVFEHKYRTFKPFICYIGIYLINAEIYIVDMLRFKSVLRESKLLRCGIPKILHCEECARLLTQEFGDIGCYINFPQTEKSIYVDWRIRPIIPIMIDVIVKSLKNTVEKLKENIPFEKYMETEEEDFLEVFKAQNCLQEHYEALSEILETRAYYARMCNESVEYILSDEQILIFLQSCPKTMADVDVCLPRLSAEIRPYMTDFLTILNSKQKEFSIKRLKNKIENDYEIPEEITRGKKFGILEKDKTSCESTFEISDVEE
ncbi:hypothetical protein EHP00_1809 [Ecytonucleospora hepatopenaei]|uniref:HRDC domain-containing protein n=1 Tax=Ecytonucleospora hepatopenaei TaxID=646526 RepID=A0A1W0E711_9MICR|nr:hypothetical protein EHP00_1809 [Ecytonucleospora hepatopenaei]